MKKNQPKTKNLAYPLIEAAFRVDTSLLPSEEWSGIISASGIDFRLPKTVNIEDIKFLHGLEWSRNDDLIHIMLERSAYRLGYAYSNSSQTFRKTSV